MGSDEKMEISDAAKSGDGTIVNVGIKVTGKFKSPVTNQWFDTQEALDLHLKYLHKPGQGPAVEEWRSCFLGEMEEMKSSPGFAKGSNSCSFLYGEGKAAIVMQTWLKAYPQQKTVIVCYISLMSTKVLLE